MPTGNDSEFWKRKLAAYLHDPPEKALDLAGHEKRANAHKNGLRLENTDFGRDCDHTAAAADRLPWPHWKHLESAFDGSQNHFKHPLGRSKLEINLRSNAENAHDIAQESRPVLTHEDARAQFFAFWRLWRWWASDHPNPSLAFLPADTRLPDHTIWIHNSAVSALQACVTGSGNEAKCQPAFLLFQIGPVQEYIAQARRTLDLWSGSYLLSYLIGCGLRHIALNYGPDNVVFPNLCGQPIFDLLLKDDVWTKARVKLESRNGNQTLWDAFGYDSDYGRRRLFTPSLPNRFLALVPADKAADIARDVEGVIREAHKNIADEVWNWAKEHLASANVWTDTQRRRFNAQNERFLEIAWQVLPWPGTPDEAFNSTAVLPDAQKHAEDQGPRASLHTILEMAKRMPTDHRDFRNFECERFPERTHNSQGRNISGWKDRSKLKDDAKLDNPGAAWSALYQLVSWQLDAVRQTRAWKAWATGGWDVGRASKKDSLNGREEALLDLRGPDWNEQSVDNLNDKAKVPNLFKPGELLGATSLIKRLWPSAWLQTNHDFKNHDWRMPDTRHIADAKPFARSDDDPEFDADADRASDRDANKYFAVLALDGDEIGKWISGLHPNMPKLGDQLANYEEGDQRKGAIVYFENNSLDDLLKRKRPLSPSFHLQFSEMLSNFALLCASPIVEAFDGRLIYAGGDNVVALLPADTALACAQALRMAFQGDLDIKDTLTRHATELRNRHLQAQAHDRKASPPPHYQKLAADGCLLHADHRGFLQRLDQVDPQNRPIPFLVPGPAADCSVGIAIAHFKAPLQDVVRAAWDAEDRAKKKLGRSAVAVTLCKRSGETIEWGTKWDGGGLKLYRAIADALKADQLSAKFPHRFTELLEAYVTDSTPLIADNKTVQPLPNFPVKDIIRREFEHCLDRQRGTRFPREKEAAKLLKKLHCALESYLASLCKQDPSDPSHPSDLSDATERALRALIGLCQTVAFAHRTAAETTNPEPKGT